MIEYLEIRRGGKLVETIWKYNNRTKTGKYVKRDTTQQAPSHLFQECKLQKGLTLRDIFLLLNSNIEIFDAVLGNHCSEIVKEGLLPYRGKQDKQGLSI